MLQDVKSESNQINVQLQEQFAHYKAKELVCVCYLKEKPRTNIVDSNSVELRLLDELDSNAPTKIFNKHAFAFVCKFLSLEFVEMTSNNQQSAWVLKTQVTKTISQTVRLDWTIEPGCQVNILVHQHDVIRETDIDRNISDVQFAGTFLRFDAENFNFVDGNKQINIMPYSVNNSERFDTFDEECYMGFFLSDTLDISKVKSYLLAHTNGLDTIKFSIEKANIINYINQIGINKNQEEL